jgi:hypothetical protein
MFLTHLQFKSQDQLALLPIYGDVVAAYYYYYLP